MLSFKKEPIGVKRGSCVAHGSHLLEDVEPEVRHGLTKRTILSGLENDSFTADKEGVFVKCHLDERQRGLMIRCSLVHTTPEFGGMVSRMTNPRHDDANALSAARLLKDGNLMLAN